MEPASKVRHEILTPIYTPENCNAAFQLNWSVSLFGNCDFPPLMNWIEPLKRATESDGVRILDVHVARFNVVQFFVSTLPEIAPSEIVRSIKGRWQYILKEGIPSPFRRNYFIASLGEANSVTLNNYVAQQLKKHPMADSRVMATLDSVQYYDPKVEVDKEQIGNYGKFIYALHVVIENAEGWNEIRDDVLIGSQEMVIRASKSKGWRLGRIGLLPNHLHVLLGCAVTESPESVALSLLNNLAYVQEMKPVFRYSYYVGTCGKYDRDAVRMSV